MKAIVLAAGYATRLYPLTKKFPKPLLEVQGRTILDRLLQSMDRIAVIDEFIIVSNHKFFLQFNTWKNCCEKNRLYSKKITIIDDGSVDNEHRLGAVQDIVFALETCGIHDDIFVLAGDNVLDFELADFVSFQKTKGAVAIMRHREESLEKLKKTGVIEIDEHDKVLSMEEKPVFPKSHWAVPPFYIYPAAMLFEIKNGIASGCGTDAPGSFIAWYCKNHTVYAWQMSGRRYDVGNLESYKTVQKVLLK